jgi:hypothetical protein
MPPNFCHHILQDAGTGNARGRSAASPAHAPCNPNFKSAAGLQHPTQKFTSPHYYDVDSSYYGGVVGVEGGHHGTELENHHCLNCLLGIIQIRSPPLMPFSTLLRCTMLFFFSYGLGFSTLQRCFFGSEK